MALLPQGLPTCQRLLLGLATPPNHVPLDWPLPMEGGTEAVCAWIMIRDTMLSADPDSTLDSLRTNLHKTINHLYLPTGREPLGAFSFPSP